MSRRERTTRPTIKVGDALSKREQEVLYWMALGEDNWEIAARLHLSQWTVKVHVFGVLKKLNAANRAHAIHLAWHAGILRADTPTVAEPGPLRSARLPAHMTAGV